jgi:hypothetical protein
VSIVNQIPYRLLNSEIILFFPQSIYTEGFFYIVLVLSKSYSIEILNEK